jgi:putative tricarboxylic transport membrane protein
MIKTLDGKSFAHLGENRSGQGGARFGSDWKGHIMRKHRARAEWIWAAAALACLFSISWPVQAQVKGLEIVAPGNPGSGYDQAARAMQETLQSAKLASGVQVINSPGAGGTIGLAQFVTGRKRNPSVLVVAFSLIGSIVTNKPAVTTDNAVPLARLIREWEVVTVPANSDVKTMADLVAKLKADPSKVSWALGSPGGIDHVLAGQIAKALGVDPSKLKVIHYSGGGEQVAATLGGHVTVALGGVPEFAPQVQAGQLRAIAVSSPERLPGVDTPTLKEQGVDVELGTWRGLMMHPQTNEADRKALTEAVAEMVKTPAWKDVLTRYGWIEAYQPAAEFGPFLKEQQTLISEALKDLGVAK